MTPRKSPVFIVGCARSGTSLVYSILQASGEFAIYAAETLLLRTCAGKYGRLAYNKNYKRFLEDWLRSKQFIRSGLDREKFLREVDCHRASYYDFLNFFMSSIAEQQGADRWAENTPNHVLEIRRIAHHFPDAVFIHVIRDGRAVALSLDKLGWIAVKSPSLRLISAALHWRKQVTAGRKLGKQLGSRYMELSYEKLVHNPDETLHDLSEFIDAPLDMHTLVKNPKGALQKSNTVFSADDNEQNSLFSTNAVSRWKSILSRQDQARLNYVIGPTLKEFGYELGETQRVSWGSIVYCNIAYQTKEWCRQHTLLGRYAQTGLELDAGN